MMITLQILLFIFTTVSMFATVATSKDPDKKEFMAWAALTLGFVVVLFLSIAYF